MKPTIGLFTMLALPAFLAPSRLLAGDGEGLRVAVCVDVTPEGLRAPKPAPGKPVLYAPVAAGYREIGAILTFYQRPGPPNERVLGQLEKAVAAQGYLPGGGDAAPIVLSVRWGYVAPQTAPFRRFPPGRPAMRNTLRITNREEVMSYVIGEKWRDLAIAARRGTLDPGTQELFDSVRDAGNDATSGGAVGRGARYYVHISAYDGPAFLQKRPVLLWRVHASTEYWGHYLDEVIPTLIEAAAPYLGRDTPRPVVATVPLASWAPADKTDKPEGAQVALVSRPELPL